PERSRLASHSHSSALRIRFGIDPNGNRGSQVQLRCYGCNPLQLDHRLRVDFTDAFGERELDLSGSFSRTSKQKAIRYAAAFPRLVQFAGRSDFQTSTLRQEKRQDIQVGICLYRVVDIE